MIQVDRFHWKVEFWFYWEELTYISSSSFAVIWACLRLMPFSGRFSYGPSLASLFGMGRRSMPDFSNSIVQRSKEVPHRPYVTIRLCPLAHAPSWPLNAGAGNRRQQKILRPPVQWIASVVKGFPGLLPMYPVRFITICGFRRLAPIMDAFIVQLLAGHHHRVAFMHMATTVMKSSWFLDPAY